jgi:hypothetical protein
MTTRYLPLYSQKSLPVIQNKVYASAGEAKSCLTGDVSLVQDLQTGLIFNQDFRPELVVYDSSYQNEQGLSRRFQEHLYQVMGIIEWGMGRVNLVEVGCGKGLFLEMMLAAGFDVAGFDPTYEGSNTKVKRHFFEKGVGIQANGLILRHVLEHIQNPVTFLHNLAQANNGKGRIYIEVPCFDWICENKTWFDVFYEHVNYFRLSDFHRIFSKVIESGRIFGGQYLYVVADLSSIREPACNDSDLQKFPEDFANAILNIPEKTSEQCVVWGASSKGVIFSILKSRTGHPVNLVVDINPAKQGKHLPVTGLKVHSPDAVVPNLPEKSPIYVMNSNYLEEIKFLSSNKFIYILTDKNKGLA